MNNLPIFVYTFKKDNEEETDPYEIVFQSDKL